MTSTLPVHHVWRGIARLLEHTIAVVVGFVMMIVGLALGVTMIMLPVGLVIGLLGVAILIGGLFVRIDDIHA